MYDILCFNLQRTCRYFWEALLPKTTLHNNVTRESPDRKQGCHKGKLLFSFLLSAVALIFKPRCNKSVILKNQQCDKPNTQQCDKSLVLQTIVCHSYCTGSSDNKSGCL